MHPIRRPALVAAVLLLSSFAHRLAARDVAAVAPLPPGVHAVWDAASAYRETTDTRERLCLNGLWRWQPVAAGNGTVTAADGVPGAGWGHFKVPGSWPGITDYMQKDSQTVFAHAAWKDVRLREIESAWYERTLAVPATWAGRRIALTARQVNSLAAVYIDGTRVGEIRFPGGELDLTRAVRPGATHRLSLRVRALPLRSVLVAYVDTNTAREMKGRVARRGLCGDVFLVGAPAGGRVEDVQVTPSWRKREVAFSAALAGLAPAATHRLEARVSRGGVLVRSFTSRPFGAADLVGGRFAFTAAWMPEHTWDLHTPENQYDVTVALRAADGRVADTGFAARFGWREFWIEGRDFYLNGMRLHLSMVPLDNAQVSAGLAGYAGARESLERLKAIGINFVYTHNYGCEPGSHLQFDEILRAADDAGMLVAFSQPHFSHYDWKAPDADTANGYAAHAEYYVRVGQNHPSVVAYAMNHNATGYAGDMNPELIDGVQDPRPPAAQGNARLARRAEAIVRRFDAGRVIYHHSSGNLGAMHTINFYPNFVPPQELSDWFEPWATRGMKPVFLCEYGAPFSWDWTMYRGWYQGAREFGSARVPWQFCLAEWNAQFLGDRAYAISRREAENLRWEAKQIAAGRVWHRWDYPHQVSSRDFDERYPIFAHYLADNWPAFRTWGVSAISPWEFGHYWKPRDGVDRRRQELPVDWAALQRPGFSADYAGERYERMDLAFGRDDWVPTEAARALLRYNQAVLAYLAGKPAAFTSKDHTFVPGETVEKQLIVINNSRVPVRAAGSWRLELPTPAMGTAEWVVAPGEQHRQLLRFALPEGTRAGEYALTARVRFDGGAEQADALALHVVAPPAGAGSAAGRWAVFDPAGDTDAVLRRAGVRATPVEATSTLAGFDVLVIGKGALAPGGPAPDLGRVREGLKVIVFEQSAAVLEGRFGFRVAEYGLRRVFPRVPDHPALRGVDAEHLRDWRGEATLMPPRLAATMHPRLGPTVQWAGLTVPRLWRGGNRGNVASVLIEKPGRGDFLPIVEGGFELQYSPLLEFREGRGVILFCQLDVTGRTEDEPVAGRIGRNLFEYVAAWLPSPVRRAYFAGDDAAVTHLAAAGVTAEPYRGGALPSDAVLVLGPGAGRRLEMEGRATVGAFVRGGGRVVGLGVGATDLAALAPVAIAVEEREHIAAHFAPAHMDSALAGIGPADVHNRDPRRLPLVVRGAEAVGNGVLATTADGRVVLFQMPPWLFDPVKQSNWKRTFRRAAFTTARLLANQGVAGHTPLLDRFRVPCLAPQTEQRWRSGLYLDEVEEWDDPYRFFRW